MKTTEQLRKEFINYLTKCTNHTFVKGIDEWRRVSINRGELKNFVKIFQKEDGFEIYEFGKVRKITYDIIDKMIQDYIGNAKNQIKMSIFSSFYSERKLRSIRNTKYIESQIQSILSKEGKSDPKILTPKPKKEQRFWSKIFK